MQRSSNIYERKQFKTVLNKYVGGFVVRGQKGLDCFVFTLGSVTVDCGQVFWPEVMV